MADIFDTLEEPAASGDIFDEIVPDEREQKGKELRAQMVGVRGEVIPKLARGFSATVEAPGKLLRSMDEDFNTPAENVIPYSHLAQGADQFGTVPQIIPPGHMETPEVPISPKAQEMSDINALRQDIQEKEHPARTAAIRTAEGLRQGLIRPSGAIPLLATAVAPEVLAPFWMIQGSQGVHDAVEKIRESRKEGNSEKYWEGVYELGVNLPVAMGGTKGTLNTIPGRIALPRSLAAVAETQPEITTAKEPNALQKQSTEEVLRDVPKQPSESAREVSAEKGTRGVPQRDVSQETTGGTEVPLSEPTLESSTKELRADQELFNRLSTEGNKKYIEHMKAGGEEPTPEIREMLESAEDIKNKYQGKQPSQITPEQALIYARHRAKTGSQFVHANEKVPGINAPEVETAEPEKEVTDSEKETQGKEEGVLTPPTEKPAEPVKPEAAHLPVRDVLSKTHNGTGDLAIGGVYEWTHPDPKFQEFNRRVIVAGKQVGDKVPTYSFTGPEGLMGLPPKSALPELTSIKELSLVKESTHKPESAQPTPVKPETSGKQPWEMTKSEFGDDSTIKPSGKDAYLIDPNGQRWLSAGTRSKARAVEVTHRAIVQRAINEGKPVPPEVLEDYPDLKPSPESVPQSVEPSIPEKIVTAIESEAQKARERLSKRGTIFGSGPMHELPNIRDHAIILASKIARGTFEVGKWTAEMVAKYGEAIRPHLQAIITEAHKVIREWANPKEAALTDPTTPIQKIQSVFTPGLEAGRNIKEGIQSLLLPSAKGPAQLEAAEMLGARLGEMHHSQEASASALVKPSKEFDRLGVHNPNIELTENPGIRFMSDVSQGRDLGKFKKTGELVRKEFDKRLEQLEEVGAEVQNVRENYFPGMWTRDSRLAFNAAMESAIKEGIIPETFDINDATPEQKSWIRGASEKMQAEGKGSDRDMLSYFTRKPLKGRESFRKQKVFDDIMTGVEFGLKPISNNPIDLVIGKLAEMDKSVMANRFFRQVDDAGKLRIIRPGQEVPEGWVKLDDRYGTIYGPRSPSGEFGHRIMGYRIVPEPVGEVVNNYLSSSLYNNRYVGTLYKAWMASANALNQSQLGVGSAFHAGFTTADVQVSAGASLLKDIYGLVRGNRYLSDLESTFGKWTVSSVRTAITGDKVLNAWRNPDGVIDPRIREVVRATELAGGGYRLEKGLATEQTAQLRRDWFSGKRLKAALRSPVAFTELMAKPIMQFLVPRQKAGVFSELAWRIIDQNPGKSLEELTPQFRQAWNRVDSRLGQVLYDRLFINNTAKNIVQGLVRAPGWTGGTIAEIGGAFPDAYKFLKEWKDTGKPPENIPDRVAYTASLLLTVGALNAILTRLFTGSNPQGLDYVAFRTGNKDEQGNEERFLLPTYVKDLLAYSRDFRRTVEHKTHPLLGMFEEISNNRDYYGYEIRNPHAGLPEQGKEIAEYVIKSFEPFWTRGARKEIQRDSSLGKVALPYVGVMPAPANINRTRIQNKISELYHIRTGDRTKPYGSQEQDAEKRSARNRSNLDVYMFQRLPRTDQLELRNSMTPEERARYLLR